tara:strand:- start:1396 stop:1821 length:426 start_codon:yes stop_codon:yes gene_type:complete
MLKERSMLYLGYGMNMNVDSMASRCPAAVSLGGFYLPNYRLVFRGVADVVEDKDSYVPVALWLITKKCLKSLDQLEGYPSLYNRKIINGRWWMYYMNDKSFLAPPSEHYYKTIENGYDAFDLDSRSIRVAKKEAINSIIAA